MRDDRFTDEQVSQLLGLGFCYLHQHETEFGTPAISGVTSVSGSGSVSGITLSGLVTSTGSLTLGGTLQVVPNNFADQTANRFLASPNGSNGAPTFRNIVAADVPTLNQNTSGYARSVSCPDGDRDPNTKLPISFPQQVRFDFSLASYCNTGGNYAGVMTFSPWTGTTSSTGDASYQLAFGNSAINAGGYPQLNIRQGIDSTWGNWYNLIHSGMIGSGLLFNSGALSVNPSIQQVSASSNYTCVATDAGKHIFHPLADATARTFTIPSNASVPYPVGTPITFVNQRTAGVVTIAINSDSMYLAGPATSGSRTLAPCGIATAIKVTATEWIISGVGLS